MAELQMNRGEASVVFADTRQSANDIPNVRAENASVGVNLVDHNGLQILEETSPSRVIRKDARVKHIGVRQNHATFFAKLAAQVGWRVAIIRARHRCQDVAMFPKTSKPSRLILGEALVGNR